MTIAIETSSSSKYYDIQKEYGSVLHKYGLSIWYDGSARIVVDRMEDLIELDNDIRDFMNQREDWCVYFGILVRNDAGSPVIIIRDNYD